MEFSIVDGETSRLSPSDYEKFKEDYLNSPLTSNEVRKSYGLSIKEYSILTNQIREELGIMRRPRTNSKHFYKQGNKWWIIKTINKKRVCYGALPVSRFSMEDVEEVVKKLSKMDWDYTLCTHYIQELKGNVI